MKSQKTILDFRIDHCDPLGQGVDKGGEAVTFIAKTLPGETGRARIRKSKKGVRFAQLIAVEAPSAQRRPAECSHFDACPGCDYLHTDYQTELAFKTAALKKSFQKIAFDWDRLRVLGAPERLGYRNRIQLHYRDGRIGLVDGLQDRIVEIPDCRMIRDPLRPVLKKIYEDKSWQNKHSGEGHLELYFHHDQLHVTWNRPYAAGGFSQVNDAMNAVLRETVAEAASGMAVSSLLDLFSGDGNLSNAIVKMQGAKRVCVDAERARAETARTEPDFIRLDLFKPSALKAFEKKVAQDRFDVLLLDPPRKGFPALNDWVLRYRPKALIYASCHPGALARDLSGLHADYGLAQLMLIDLFPGTRHFETLAHLRPFDEASLSIHNGQAADKNP